MKRIEYYTTENGKCPYIEWFEKLTYTFQAKILARLDRLIDGNKGDFKHLQNSELSELRFHFGSGYRIYYKEFDNIIILLLTGSDKSNQTRAIKKADEYLKDYVRRNLKNDN